MSYPGSKGQAGVYQRIIGQMPPHDTYVEPFAGSAFIYFAKKLALKSFLCDLDWDVANNLEIKCGGADKPTYTHCCNAMNWLPRLNAWRNQTILVYCDPPYLMETRKHRRYYKHEMTDADHARLLDVLLTLDCHVMLSGYPSALYSSKLQSWRCQSYRTRTRGAAVTECLWMNFPEPTELHDWRFAGRTYRERLSLKRLATRWVARLDGMSPRKRGYVLNAIREHE